MSARPAVPMTPTTHLEVVERGHARLDRSGELRASLRAEDFRGLLRALQRVFDRSDLGDEIVERLAGLEPLDRLVQTRRRGTRVESRRLEQVEEADAIVQVAADRLECGRHIAQDAQCFRARRPCRTSGCSPRADP
jgi:hypothetical protein